MAQVANFSIRQAIASDIQAIFQALKPNQVRKVRSEELTAEEVSELNQKTVGNSFACFVQATRENLEALASIRPVQEGEAPQVTIAGKGYVFERNKQNRPLSESRVLPVTKPGTYSNQAARGLWGTMAGVLLFTDEGQIASAQHTIAGFLGALENGVDMESSFLFVVFGLPPQFRDWSDKGRARNKKQDSFIDENLFPQELLQELQAELTPAGKDHTKERMTLVEFHSKVAASVLARLGGKDISKTGDKLSWADEKLFCDRFDNSDDLQRLCVMLLEASKDSSGKIASRTWSKELFSPAIVGTGLILASNSADVIDTELQAEVVRKEDESPEEYRERVLTARTAKLAADAPIRINWELVKQVLSLLEQSTDNAGPLEKVFADLLKRKNDDKKSGATKDYLYAPLSRPSISAFVELVNNIQAENFSSSCWTSYRLDATTKKYPTTYRNFGGMDCGYIAGKKSKKDDE